MADWFNITEAMTDPFAPGTSELWKAWWKNPVAIAEGAVGAPRIQVAAFPTPAAGGVIQRRCTPMQLVVSNSSTPTTHYPAQTYFTALIPCVVRVTFTVSITISGGGSPTPSGQFSILRNGSILTTYTTNQTNQTYDVALGAGENISLALVANGNSSGSSATIDVTRFEYSFDNRSAIMS